MQLHHRLLCAALATAVGVVPVSLVTASPVAAADPASALGNVVINEVSSNGFTHDGAANTDFVELYNKGTANVDLSGYRLVDSGDVAGATVLEGVLPAGGYAAFVPPAFGIGGTDNVRLFAPDGTTLIDAVTETTWPSHRTPSAARIPDGTGAFTLTSTTGPSYPTPGGPNGLTTDQAYVTVNEYSSTGGADFVEIHNSGSATVDLAGWRLADGNGTPTTGDEIVLGGASALVPAKGYLQVRTEDLTQTDFTFVNGGFGLNGLDDVWLSTPDGALVATTSGASGATDQHPDPSWGRTTPGTGLWKVTSADTPASANTFPTSGGEVPPLDPNWSNVEINEVSSLNADQEGNPGFGDAVELHNKGASPVSIEGWWQVDAGLNTAAQQLTLADLKVWSGTGLVAATDMVIPAGGYVAFESTKGLSGEGDSVKVYGPSATPGAGQLVDEASYGDGDGGVSDNYESDSLAFAACPNGSDEFWRVTESSFGQDNTASCATKSRRLDTTVVLNEVSNVSGKAELLNTGATGVDISGWQLLDASGAVVHTVPVATELAGGAFYLAEGIVGLDSADSLTIRRASDQSTVVAHTWFEEGIASYSRCELFGSVSYVETPTATFGSANACPSLTTAPWPGAAEVATVDLEGGFGDVDGNGEGDVSGAAFDPVDPSILWVVQNKNTLHKMHKVDGKYVAVAGWEQGKKLHFADGEGKLDAEGLTVGPNGSLYVTSERDNDNSGVSANKVARFDLAGVGAATTDLTAAEEWDVNDFVVTGANLGLEGITYVPDAFLVKAGWRAGGTQYTPAAHPTPGLWVTAVEGTGDLHFFSLPSGGEPVEVKVEESGLPWAMDVAYDADRGRLWALCDDSCGGVHNLLQVVGGDLAVEASFARPAGMPNLNNEGMAIAPRATCVGGFQEVVWTDDGDTDGFSLRAGTLPCPPAPKPDGTGSSAGCKAAAAGLSTAQAALAKAKAKVTRAKKVLRKARRSGKPAQVRKAKKALVKARRKTSRVRDGLTVAQANVGKHCR